MFQKLLTIFLVAIVLMYTITESTIAQSSCESNQFECTDGQECIHTPQQCNGYYDCSDRSDERNCRNFTCLPGKLQCKSGHCFYESDRCNGRMNCRDKSDELNCTECKKNAFVCAAGGCVVKEWVCDSVPDCLDGSDEVNDDCQDRISNHSFVPLILKVPTDKNVSSFLAYNDDLIATYFDEFVSKSTTWPFALLRKAWAYAKNIYEPLHINFRLNVVLRIAVIAEHNSCSTFSANDTDWWGYPNSIECRSSDSKFNWAVETTENYELLLSQLCEIVQRMRRQSSLDYWIRCQEEISDLIFYDMYVYLKGYDSAQFLEWKAKQLATYDYKSTRTYCFRDWYLPIYEAYGGTEVLVNFFRLMIAFLKYHLFGFGSTTLKNEGQFLHIWSEAAGTDLKYLYTKTRKWTSINERELKEAKESYHLNYTLNSCHLSYIDQHAAVYFFDPNIYETSFVKLVSQGWQYVKKHYGPFTNQSIQTMILQYQNITLNRTTCIPLNNGIQKRTYFLTIINRIARDSDIEKSVFLDEVMSTIAHLTLNLTPTTGTWPGRVVSNWSMSPIIVYDIYLGLNLKSNANKWKEIQLTKTTPALKIGKFWFRDWYLPMYETNNKSDTLKYFLSLLNTTWDRKDGNLTKQLNMGEFVHFWSAAAERSLLTNADDLIGWNLKFQNEFIQARKDFPNLNNYSCINCDDFQWKSYVDQKNRTREELLLIIIGTFLGFSLITLTVTLPKVMLDRKRIRELNKTIRSLTAEELDEFLSGNLDKSCNDANVEVLSVPYNTDFELPKDRLVVDQNRVLGSGEFGFVFHGILKGDEERGTADVEVAVKTVKPNVEITYFKALLSEIKIMAHLGLHENIVSLMGTVTGNILNCEVFIALELCPKGNLLHFLQQNSHQFQAPWTQSVFQEFQTILNNTGDSNETEISINEESCGSENVITLSTEKLLTWSSQIANGMSYISSKKVIHGDLAARNILLTFNNVAKISDFGLSRQLAKYSIYQKTSKTPIPWKWLAIESLVDKTFSVNSDVWSFGITLWEIFTLGKEPYPGKCWGKLFVNNLLAGERPKFPEYGNKDIYDLMLNCWKKEPTERISFQEILSALTELTEQMSGGAGIISAGKRN